MKKMTTTCFAMLVCMTSLANSGILTLQTDYTHKGGKEERRTGINNTVPFDDNSIYLRTDSGAVAATITITGTGGTIMYCGQTVLTPGVQAINVPDTDGEEKYMIEITTDRRRLYGYFM